MDTNLPRTTEVTQAELELLEALREDPLLAENLRATLRRYASETNTGMDAHQAETAIVEITRDLGRRMLTGWGQQTQEETARIGFSHPDLVGHGKKNSAGTAPSAPSQSDSRSSGQKPAAKPDAPSSRKRN